LKKLFSGLLIILLAAQLSTPLHADAESAQAAMEDPTNPLLLLSTSTGDIYIELLAREAPNNVENFLALAHGEIEFVDPNSNVSFQPRYFDGMQFHRVVPGFVIQAGSPYHNPLGQADNLLRDEINADSLGLNQQMVLDSEGNFNPLLNVKSKQEFHDVLLKPLYASLGIESEAEMLDRQFEVFATLSDLTIKQAYEIQGYRFSNDVPTRGISRGIVALANAGANQNGPEFFIALDDAPWLAGKHTVIGKVIEGMETADAIGNTEVDPVDPSRFATLIYSLRRIN
jgi:cyclophilin family peptidyl-prolyl cis-trans isomerase